MKFAADTEQANASIDQAHQQQKLDTQTAAANEDRVRAANAQKLASQRAAAVQSGFDANSGTFADLQGESAGNAELDALTERYKGQLGVWQQGEQIKQTRAQVRMGAVSLIGSAVGGYFGGTGSYLGTSYH